MVAAEFWEHQNVYVKLLRKTFKEGLARQEKTTVAQPVQLVQSITGEILTDISGHLWGQRAARNLVVQGDEKGGGGAQAAVPVPHGLS